MTLYIFFDIAVDVVRWDSCPQPLSIMPSHSSALVECLASLTYSISQLFSYRFAQAAILKTNSNLIHQ
jgi:hypothetical protein